MSGKPVQERRGCGGMLRLVAALVLVFVACSTALAASSVWQARKGDRVIYLGGTCHVLRDADYPLPAEYDRAYAAADLVVFETDIGRLGEPEIQRKLLAGAGYADGSTLDRHLSPGVYGELRAYCENSGIPLELLGRLKPSLLVVTLTVLELKKLGVTSQGVDQHFYDRAKRDGKPIAGLESLEDHLNYILTMADGDEDGFVSQSLRDLRSAGEQFDALAGAWRRGDDASLEALMLVDFKARQPKMYDRLITERNRNWLAQIDAPRKTRPTPFYLVGAGHLVGKDGILAALAKKVYTVTRL